jgi:hypothetical protein
MASPAPKNSRNAHEQSPLGWQFIPDVGAFALGLGLAYYLKWQTSDLVWSLWLCSLVLGYTTLLSTMAGHAIIGFTRLRKSSRIKHRALAVLGWTGLGMFYLAFFSIHFCGFHSIHSVFLEGLFPVEGMPKDGFGDAFINPPLLFIMVFKSLVRPYGLALLPMLIAERKYVFQGLISAMSAVREGVNPELLPTMDGDRIGQTMGKAYVNVVRMHLLIFVFGISKALKIDSFAIYAIVYFVYFFPWSEVKRLKPSNRASHATSEPARERLAHHRATGGSQDHYHRRTG